MKKIITLTICLATLAGGSAFAQPSAIIQATANSFVEIHLTLSTDGNLNFGDFVASGAEVSANEIQTLVNGSTSPLSITGKCSPARWVSKYPERKAGKIIKLTI